MFKTLALIAMLTISLSAQTIRGSAIFGATAVDITAVTGDVECGVSYVQFYVDGVAVGPQILPTPGSNTYLYAWDSRTVPDGPHTLTAKATDKAGLNGACDSTKPNTSTSAPIYITVSNAPSDVTPPTITLTPVQSGAVITAKQQPIQVAAADASAIKQITLKINGVVKASVADQNTLSLVWNTNPYKGLTVVLEAGATDAYGNTSTLSRTVSVKK